MRTEHLTPDSSLTESQSDTVRRVLHDGGVVAFPTESFYGLGVSAFDALAVERLLELKADRGDKPLPLVLGSTAAVLRVATDIPPFLETLAQRFWPGPLTVVLEARDDLPSALTANTGTIAVRVPGHAIARAIAKLGGGAVTATSANPSARPPPRNAAGVDAYFAEQIQLVVDAGETAGGKPSTIIDLRGGSLAVLRRGAIEINAIEASLGRTE